MELEKLRIRLIGTRNEIKWFMRILRRHPKVVLEELPGQLYRDNGTSGYYRAYAKAYRPGRKQDEGGKP